MNGARGTKSPTCPAASRHTPRLRFKLEEIKDLLLLKDGQSDRETQMLAERKLDLIEERIADLSRTRRLLKGLIAECAEGKRPRSCPSIATLSADV